MENGLGAGSIKMFYEQAKDSQDIVVVINIQ